MRQANVWRGGQSVHFRKPDKLSEKPDIGYSLGMKYGILLLFVFSILGCHKCPEPPPPKPTRLEQCREVAGKQLYALFGIPEGQETLQNEIRERFPIWRPNLREPGPDGKPLTRRKRPPCSPDVPYSCIYLGPDSDWITVPREPTPEEKARTAESQKYQDSPEAKQRTLDAIKAPMILSCMGALKGLKVQ